MGFQVVKPFAVSGQFYCRITGNPNGDTQFDGLFSNPGQSLIDFNDAILPYFDLADSFEVFERIIFCLQGRKQVTDFGGLCGRGDLQFLGRFKNRAA